MCNLKENAGIIYTDYKLTRRIEPPVAQTKQPRAKPGKSISAGVCIIRHVTCKPTLASDQ